MKTFRCVAMSLAVFLIGACGGASPSTTTTTRPPTTTTTTRPPTTTTTTATTKALQFRVEGSRSAEHGGLRFTLIDIQKYGRVVKLEGHEHTAVHSWLVVILRVENISDGVPTYKSRDQTLISGEVAYEAESDMRGVDDSQWVINEIPTIPLFFDVPPLFPGDGTLLTLNLIDNDSDIQPPALINLRASRSTSRGPATTTTSIAPTTTQAAATTQAPTTTQAKSADVAPSDSEDDRYLTLLRGRASLYDSEYLFRVYSDEELTLLGREFCSELTTGVSLETLYGSPMSIAEYVLRPMMCLSYPTADWVLST